MASVSTDEAQWRAGIEKQIADIEHTLRTYTNHIGPSGEIYIKNLMHMRSLRRIVADLKAQLERGMLEITKVETFHESLVRLAYEPQEAWVKRITEAFRDS